MAVRSNHGGRSERRACRLAAPALVIAALAGAAAPAESAAPAGSLAAAPGEISSGEATTLTGTLLDGAGAPLAGASVELQVDPYPYRGFVDAAHTAAAADGSFVFPGVRPDRNTRYRVRSPAGLSQPLTVYVDAPAVLASYDRGPGRSVLTMISRHSAYFRWVGVRAYWYVAPTGSRSFRLAAVTHTRELRPGVTYASATVDPPAAHFVFRVCLNGRGDAGVGPPASHAPCPHGDFRALR